MNRRKRIIPTFLLAATASYLAWSTTSVRAADPASEVNDKVASDPQDQKNELRGIEALFAKATNAAVTAEGLQSVAAMFVPETRGGEAVGDVGTATAPVVQTPVAGPVTGGANASPHATLAQKFNSAWQSKYHESFHIADDGVVFLDITADALRRPRHDVGLKLNNPPATQPAAKTPATTGDSAHSGNLRTASGAIIPRTDANSLKPLSEQVVVHIPAVGELKAVDLHVMREGPADFKFVSIGEANPADLGIDIDRHLAAIMVDETKWPLDVHQAQRLISQELLLAVADYEAEMRAANARPTAARIPGSK